MVDEVDRLVAMEARQLDNALLYHAQRPQASGRAFCANEDCGEAITAQRQAMGAQLCIACAKAEEARAAHFRVWRR